MKNENATPTIKHDGQLSIPHGGLTLRDYFAAKALQGICASGPGATWTDDRLTKDAYRLADAMLSERNK